MASFILAAIAFIGMWLVVLIFYTTRVQNDTQYTLHCVNEAGPAASFVQPGRSGKMTSAGCGVLDADQAYVGCLQTDESSHPLLASRFVRLVPKEECPFYEGASSR